MYWGDDPVIRVVVVVVMVMLVLCVCVGEAV